MKVISVTALTTSIKNQLEGHFPALHVEGEVSNLRTQASGHIYFTLKDAHSQISAVLFRRNAQLLSRKPKDGDRVIINGQLSVYAPRGNYQIIIRSVEYSGVGQLLLELHQLKEKLKLKGWMDHKYKKRLPKYPQKIGVVTSPTGSVIQDIIHVLKRRYPSFHLILNPVRVQGKGAAQEIHSAIKQFNTHRMVDIIIVGRGGGSLEDLWPFNEELVAEAIFQSEIPIISAVGHETDTTIADYIADVRAPTPSAAAEICVQELSAQDIFLKQSASSITHALKKKIHHHRQLLKTLLDQPLLRSSPYLLAHHYQRLDDISVRLNTSIQHQISQQQVKTQTLTHTLSALCPQKKLTTYTQRLNTCKQSIQQSISRIIYNHKQRLSHLDLRINDANPNTILKRGYCIPFSQKGSSVMLSSKEAISGSDIYLRFHDGTVHSRVLEDGES